MRDRLKMIEPYAPRLPAKVVEVVSFWKFANHENPEPAICGANLIWEKEISVSQFGLSAFPYPTLTTRVNLVEKSF